MFLTLLGVTFVISFMVCFLVARLFTKPIDRVLERMIADEIAGAWTKYLQFAIYVVGLSGGVQIYHMERFVHNATIEAIEHMPPDLAPPVLNTERWVLEIYRTIIETLESIALLLLVFFLFALIAYVIVRARELRSSKGE